MCQASSVANLAVFSIWLFCMTQAINSVANFCLKKAVFDGKNDGEKTVFQNIYSLVLCCREGKINRFVIVILLIKICQ